MKITFSDVTDFIAFVRPNLSEEEKDARVREAKENFSQICGETETVFLHRNQGGAINGALYLMKFQEGVLGIGNINIDPAASDELVFAALLKDAIEEACARRANRLQTRLIFGPTERERRLVLEKMGFKAGPRREEFRAEFADLPGEEGSPMRWESAGALDEMELARVAGILGRAASGDPDFHPEDDALELLKGYLQERGLSAGPECVHLGWLGRELAAIVVAQVQASNGWSRITYMGLLPEFRGQRLGRWVHRHGFSMMREQGGKFYHGGTLAENKRMIRLFESHGCKPYRQMQEWVKAL